MLQEVFAQGLSTRKMEKIVKSLGIESLRRSWVSEMTKWRNEHGRQDILAIKSLLEKSEGVYLQLFRVLHIPRLVVIDVHTGLIAPNGKGIPRANWQRCQVQFM